MPLSTLKDKGQITLPSSIRKQIHAGKGDMFDFQVQQDDQVIMTRKKIIAANAEPTRLRQKKDLSKWIGAKPGLFKSAEEVDKFIRSQRDLWN